MGAPKGLDVDHINGDQLDNRKANLRIVTRSVNLQNRQMPARKDSPYQGVYALPTKVPLWCARIGKEYLGSASSPEEANLLRLRREKELWGIAPRRQQAFAEAGLI